MQKKGHKKLIHDCRLANGYSRVASHDALLSPEKVGGGQLVDMAGLCGDSEVLFLSSRALRTKKARRTSVFVADMCCDFLSSESHYFLLKDATDFSTDAHGSALPIKKSHLKFAPTYIIEQSRFVVSKAELILVRACCRYECRGRLAAERLCRK